MEIDSHHITAATFVTCGTWYWQNNSARVQVTKSVFHRHANTNRQTHTHTNTRHEHKTHKHKRFDTQTKAFYKPLDPGARCKPSWLQCNCNPGCDDEYRSGSLRFFLSNCMEFGATDVEETIWGMAAALEHGVAVLAVLAVSCAGLSLC